MKKEFIPKNFGPERLNLIAVLNGVIVGYLAQGYRLTLRQLYYQTIARDLIPESWIDRAYNRKNGLDPDTKNTVKNYKRLGELVNDARLAGVMDWDAIEDRGRNLHRRSAWETPGDIIRSAWRSYHIDMWEGQSCRPEVWIEKESLINIAEGVCTRLDVPYYATKGYNSQSEAKDAGDRFRGYQANGQTPVCIYLGDHDPSGIDMTRDNQSRLSMFAEFDVDVIRIALNMDQVLQYTPPPNPAKATDARFAGYEAIYGDESWELDALEPSIIAALITNAITGLRNDDLWAERQALLNRQKAQLETLYLNWDEIAETL